MKKQFQTNVADDVIKVMDLYDNSLPEDNIRRVVKKMKDKWYDESFPDAVRYLNLNGVVASTLNYIECAKIIATYVSQSRGHSHPVGYVESVLEECDVAIANTGITIITTAGDKIVESKMGMIADEPLHLYLGATSTLLNYYTREETDGSTAAGFKQPEYQQIACIPPISLTGIRAKILTGVPSVSESREIIYSKLNRNPAVGLTYVDSVYSKTPTMLNQKKETVFKFAMQDPGVAKIINGQLTLNKVQATSKGVIPAVIAMDYALPEKITLMNMWMIIHISKMLRGAENSGSGSLTIGYYAYDMPSSLVKVVARVREIMMMLNMCKLQVVTLPGPNKEFPLMVHRALVANRIVVISGAGIGVYKKDDPVSVYQSTRMPSLHILDNRFPEPSYSKAKGISFFESSFQKVYESFLDANGACAVFTWLTPKIQETDSEILPSLSPHSGKVWMINLTRSETYAPNHIKRITHAVYARNLFPLTRKPFFSQDPYANIFPGVIVLPKAVRAVKDEIIDMSGFKFTPIKMEHVPLSNYEIEETDIVVVNTLDTRVDRYFQIMKKMDSLQLVQYINANSSDSEFMEALPLLRKKSNLIDSIFDSVPVQTETVPVISDDLNQPGADDNFLSQVTDLLGGLAKTNINSKNG